MEPVYSPVTLGYQFYSERKVQPTIGLRVNRVFVGGGDPSPNLVTIRLSQRLQFGRRE